MLKEGADEIFVLIPSVSDTETMVTGCSFLPCQGYTKDDHTCKLALGPLDTFYILSPNP